MREQTFKKGSRVSEPFVVMAKPVGPLCNMECSYCYYLETGRLYDNPHLFRMSERLLETYIRSYIAASPGPVIQFTWHGGEPTLAGLDFYRQVVAQQKRYLPEGWSCWNNLQTNGILLDNEWCTFLADAHFDVGLSIDGTKELHDENRKDHGGSGTYEHAVAACRRLQAHGIQPDLLCTVTSAIAKEPLAVYRALRKLDTGWIQFIPIVRFAANGQATADSVTGEAYGYFLCTIFDEWIHHDLGRLDVQLFAEMSLVLMGEVASLCWMAPTCGRVLIVEHDGKVYSCDHFVTSDHHIGDLESSFLGELVDSPVQRSFGNSKQTTLSLQCRSCAWLALCNGGCLKDRIVTAENGEPGVNYLCSGLRQFFAHAERPLSQLIQLRKRGFAPETIMTRLGTESLAH
jgi:uncharacterized protein